MAAPAGALVQGGFPVLVARIGIAAPVEQTAHDLKVIHHDGWSRYPARYRKTTDYRLQLSPSLP